MNLSYVIHYLPTTQYTSKTGTTLQVQSGSQKNLGPKTTAYSPELEKKPTTRSCSRRGKRKIKRVEANMQVQTNCGVQSWRFVVAQDADKRARRWKLSSDRSNLASLQVTMSSWRWPGVHWPISLTPALCPIRVRQREITSSHARDDFCAGRQRE